MLALAQWTCGQRLLAGCVWPQRLDCYRLQDSDQPHWSQDHQRGGGSGGPPLSDDPARVCAHNHRHTHSSGTLWSRSSGEFCVCFKAPPTLAAARIHFWRTSSEGGVWWMGEDKPLVTVEEEKVAGAELLVGLTALMISWPFLEKLKSLQASGGILLSCRTGRKSRRCRWCRRRSKKRSR